jgi:hypothetical protein
MPAKRKVKAMKNTSARSAKKKVKGHASGGDIPVGFIFDEIYRAVTEADVKKAAPQEIEQLKAHLDGASKQLKAIARKLNRQG